MVLGVIMFIFLYSSFAQSALFPSTDSRELFLAVEARDYAAVQICLQEHNCDPNSCYAYKNPSSKFFIMPPNQLLAPVIFRAIALGSNDIVALLIENQADVNKENAFATPPLCCAFKNKNSFAVRMLLDHGAKLPSIHDLIEIEDTSTLNALFDFYIDNYAIQGKNRESLKQIIEERSKEPLRELSSKRAVQFNNLFDIRIEERAELREKFLVELPVFNEPALNEFLCDFHAPKE